MMQPFSGQIFVDNYGFENMCKNYTHGFDIPIGSWELWEGNPWIQTYV